MNESDYTEMAKKFLKLWQDQVSRNLSDPAMLRNMMAMMEQFQPGHQAAGSGGAHNAADRQPAASHGAGAEPMAVLERRLSACEVRISLLESEQRAAGQSTRMGRKSTAKRKKAPARKKAVRKPAGRSTKGPAKR